MESTFDSEEDLCLATNNKIDAERNRFLSSVGVSLAIFLILSQTFSGIVIKPLLHDATLVRTGRYAMTFDAWETIADSNATSIVAIGTSLTQYGISGKCIEDRLDSDVFVYNLGIPGSMPYVEMMQTDRAVHSKPDIILLEVNPISLYSLEQASSEYLELRFTVNSILMETSDYGSWMEMLRYNESSILNNPLMRKIYSSNKYSNEAFDTLIERRVSDEKFTPHWYLSTPQPDSSEWLEYLREPTWLPSYLDSLNQSQRSEYENITIPEQLKRIRYNPSSNSTLNIIALNHMVSQFSSNGIEVVLVSYPIHPKMVIEVSPGQFDILNETMESLTDYTNVRKFDLIWQDDWTTADFYDFEHLDERGREKFCKKMSNFIANYNMT
jgi:hypothetical protein